MFIEKRKSGKKTKYYLSYTFREGGKVKKKRKYLGINLSTEELLRKRDEVEHEFFYEFKVPLFQFSLTKKEIQKLNKLDKEIKVRHFGRDEWEKFRNSFVYNTNAIEGSRVLEHEVPIILKKKVNLNSDEKETQGLAKAVDYIKNHKGELSLTLIKKLHKLCFSSTKHFAGKFRDVEVVIRDGYGRIVHRGTPHEDLDLELKKYISWYKKNKFKFKPLVLASIMHNQFEFIHPFQDGNGRVGRLLLNFILLKNNYPPVDIQQEDRLIYYRTLQEYQQNHNLDLTILFLIDQYRKTMFEVTTKWRL